MSGVAGRHPECVRAVVGLNTWAWPGASAPHFVRFSNFMGGSVGGFAIRDFNAFVNVLIPLGTPRRRLAHKPVLRCWGDMDIAFRETERARFATIFPRARTIALSGAGHCVQEESPAEIAAAIRAWWPAEVEAEE